MALPDNLRVVEEDAAFNDDKVAWFVRLVLNHARVVEDVVNRELKLLVFDTALQRALEKLPINRLIIVKVVHEEHLLFSLAWLGLHWEEEVLLLNDRYAVVDLLELLLEPVGDEGLARGRPAADADHDWLRTANRLHDALLVLLAGKDNVPADEALGLGEVLVQLLANLLVKGLFSLAHLLQL